MSSLERYSRDGAQEPTFDTQEDDERLARDNETQLVEQGRTSPIRTAVVGVAERIKGRRSEATPTALDQPEAPSGLDRYGSDATGDLSRYGREPDPRGLDKYR